jgi:hypothetical protein
MEEIKLEYETKLQKLTCFRIVIVLLCEILFEFSFGLVFFIFTENESYYGGDSCGQLLYWTKILWKIYLTEFSIASVCFCIGIMSLCCKRNILTKIYIGFYNFFKGIIFLASLVVLAIITVIYNLGEECNKLRDLTFIWLVFHYSLLGVACTSCCIILCVTGIIYKRNRSRDLLNTSLLS